MYLIFPCLILVYDAQEVSKSIKFYIKHEKMNRKRLRTLEIFDRSPSWINCLKRLQDCWWNIYFYSRTSEKFSDPNTFNPDRFNSGEGQDLYAFLPFLVGSRMCLGYKFALQEMQVIITSLLRRFEFKQIPGTEYKRKQRITMRPDPSLHLLVTPAK